MPILDRIYAGKSTFFVGEDGTVYTCGNNKYGQLGLGHTNEVINPTKTDFMHVDKIYCGEYHNIFITTAKTGYACGHNAYGQLGIGRTTPYEAIPQPILIRDIMGVGFCGLYTTFIQLNNIISLTGAAPSENLVRNSPVYVEELPEILIKDHNSLIVNEFRERPGVLGYNQYGCLGTFTTNSVPEEREISNFVGINKVNKVVVGGEHTVLLCNESVYTFGNNEKHQLGYDTPETYMSTPSILDISDVVDIAAGYEHTLVLTKNGNLYGFGSNEHRQLGFKYTKTVNTPTILANDVMKIFCGEYNSFFVHKNGTLYVTGYNKEGQLGIGDKVNTIGWVPHKYFSFSTKIHEIDLPETIIENFDKGNIHHEIRIEYTSNGTDTMYTKCYISTPSMNKNEQYSTTITNIYNTDNVKLIKTHAARNAKNLIREAKSYIIQNTVFHRNAVYKTKTIIRFNNGTTLEREGDLSEEECKAIAKAYIEDKYKIRYKNIKYYKEHEFYNNYVLGDPIWKPKYGTEVFAISEVDPKAYNTY